MRLIVVLWLLLFGVLVVFGVFWFVCCERRVLVVVRDRFGVCCMLVCL